MNDHFTSASALGKRLDVKTGTLAKWRREGRGPTGWVRVSKTLVIYPVEEVERFLESCRAAQCPVASPGNGALQGPIMFREVR